MKASRVHKGPKWFETGGQLEVGGLSILENEEGQHSNERLYGGHSWAKRSGSPIDRYLKSEVKGEGVLQKLDSEHKPSRE